MPSLLRGRESTTSPTSRRRRRWPACEPRSTSGACREYLSSRLGEVETTLHDASGVLGHDIEIHVDNKGLHDFFGMVSAGAQGWDGSEPLRPVET